MKTNIDIEYLRENNLILLECISGSKAYNLDMPSSDTDIKGVFYLPKEQFYGFSYIPQVANSSNDIVFYEIGRFLDLLAKNNPNILELLETPKDKILYKHPLMDRIQSKDFLSKKCKDTFGGYAFTQIKKAKGLNKKIMNPLPKEKKSILEFCYILRNQGAYPLQSWLNEENFSQDRIGIVSIPHFKDVFGVYYDESGVLDFEGVIRKKNATAVLLSSIPKGMKPITHLYFNEDGYKKYCRDYKEYWDWVKNRNTSRYLTNVEHGRNYDSKNIMHTFRLLEMAKEILEEGKIYVWRKDREELLKIRNGEWTYEELIKRANLKMEEIDQAYNHSNLPDQPNRNKIEKLLISLRKELYHSNQPESDG